MTVSAQELQRFTEEVLRHVPDVGSPDVTLHVFQAIEANPDFLRRYRDFQTQDARVNGRIAQLVKRLGHRENLERRIVLPKTCGLIRSYTRFMGL
jgi:hypothetical protein